MEVIIREDPTSACKLAGALIARQIKEKPDSVLGLATGTTMVPLFEELIRRHNEEQLNFSKVRTFNLDEFVDLGRDHPASYSQFMKEKLFSKINIPAGQTRMLNGEAEDIPATCAAYEQQIRDVSGIDLQVLGIGESGHIGFNEPISSLNSRTRIKTLTEASFRKARKDWPPDEDIQPHVLTMGMGTILEASCCLLLAFGGEKAKAVAQAVEGPVTARVPASALQMHERVIVLLDKSAAADLDLSDYYSYVYREKPDWQRVEE